MKTFLPVLALICLVALCAGSSIFYFNMDYNMSALLTVSWVLGISFWISNRVKERETK